MRLIISYLIFICVSVLSGFMFAFASLNKITALLSLLIGLLVALFYYSKSKNVQLNFDFKKLGFWSWFAIIAFTLFALRSFLWILYEKNHAYYTALNNGGDLSLHICFIKYFASGIKFWPDSPIITNQPLRYSVGIDFFNSLLVLSGVDLIKSLVWVGLLSSLALFFMLLNWSGPFAIATFLFNGGLAGFVIFQEGVFNDYQLAHAWKSIPITMFVTQRGFLYAMPVGLLLLSVWRDRFYKDAPQEKNLIPLWTEVLLYSTMPFFHMHTFIFLSFLLGVWTVVYPQKRKEIFNLLLRSVIPASLAVLFLTNFLRARSMFFIKTGWLGHDKPWFFWLDDFGLFIPALIALIVYLIVKNKFKINEDTAFVWSSTLAFILFCNLMLAPWDWDNMKLLIWSYIVLMPYIWKNLISNRHLVVKSMICFALFFSGFVSLVGGLNVEKGEEINALTEIIQVKDAIKDIPITERFIGYPGHNHPLTLLGRKVALSFWGWAWTHGYEVSSVERDVKLIMNGESDWYTLCKKLNVRYLYWGIRERNEYPDSKRPWEKLSPIQAGDWGSIYDLSKF